jgi:hypothetical protein
MTGTLWIRRVKAIGTLIAISIYYDMTGPALVSPGYDQLPPFDLIRLPVPVVGGARASQGRLSQFKPGAAQA